MPDYERSQWCLMAEALTANLPLPRPAMAPNKGIPLINPMDNRQLLFERTVTADFKASYE